MAFERDWNAVPPVYLIADGGSTGIIQVTDTAGFYVKMEAQLFNSLGHSLTVQIKRVLDSSTLLVGPPKTPLTTFTDCSAFTVALNSYISAAQQLKTTLPMEARMLATYEQEPVDAWRTKSVDQYGNGYTLYNPAPTNIISTSQIPLTLLSLTLPALLNDLVQSLTYDEVTMDVVGNEEILTFYSSSVVVSSVTLTKTGDGWILNVMAPLVDYLLLENGALIELENGSGAILLEA